MAKLKKGKIGILGGSFDPAHKGHLEISKIALKKFKLKRIYWIITKKNPFKSKTLYSLRERINYAKKIKKKNKHIQIKYLENIIKSSRSVKAVEYIIKKEKHKDIYFIIGSDILLKFHKWYNWKSIVKLTKLVVFSRKGYDKKSRKTAVVKYLNKNRIIFVKNKPIQISSSSLRKKILN